MNGTVGDGDRYGGALLGGHTRDNRLEGSSRSSRPPSEHRRFRARVFRVLAERFWACQCFCASVFDGVIDVANPDHGWAG